MSTHTAPTEPITSVFVPAGRYVLGDPCYSFTHPSWDTWLGEAGIDLVNEHRDHILAAPFNGHIAFGIGTAFGDGVYTDQFGNEFGVDAGLIGLVHIDSADANDVGDNRVVIDIPTDITVYGRDEDGLITIGKHEIETDPNQCADCGEKVEKYVYMCDYCEAEQDRLDDACPECEHGGYGSLCIEHTEAEDEDEDDDA